MADAQLSVELQAQVDKFVANLLAAANGADNTSNSVSKMSTNISRNIANVNKQNLSQFNAALASSNLSINKLNQSTASIRPTITKAGTDFQGFSRVLQDVAFGPGAIANNLEGLGRDFSTISRLAKESGQSIRTVLLGSLTGPGGFNLALGGLTLALSVASYGLSAWTRLFNPAKKATDDAKKSNDEYADSLDAVASAQLKGTQQAQNDLTNLRLLYGAYQNANLPLKARKEAYKELQDQYPSYFGNLKFEKEASEKTANAYTLLSQEILATARARAASDRITKNEVRKLEGEEKLINLSNERVKLLRLQDQLQQKVDAGIGAAERGDSSGAQDAIKLLGVNKDIAENLRTINNLVTDRNLLDAQNGRLVTYVNTQLEKGGKLIGGFSDKIKEVLKKDNTNILGGLFDVGNIAPSNQEFTIQPRLKIEPIVTGLSELQAEADKWNEKFTKTIESGITGTLSGIGNSIGEALANGSSVLNAIGSEILMGFGNFLSKFGDLLIEYGAAAVLKGQLDLAIATPGLGIAAGFAAIAAGIALKVVAGAIGSFASGGKASKGVTAFANGGIISGPTLGLMGEYAGAKSDPEVVAPLSKLKNLLGETDNAGNVINKNVNEPVVIVSETTIKGNDLVTVFNRANASRNRQG